MKKASIAVVLLVLFIGLRSAHATITATVTPTPVYVGQPWLVNVTYSVSADETLSACDNFVSVQNCYTTYVQAVYQGDFGQGGNSPAPGPCQEQLPYVTGNSFPLLAGGIVYGTPGTRSVTVSVYSCIPGNLGPGAGTSLGSWAGNRDRDGASAAAADSPVPQSLYRKSSRPD